MKKLKQERAQKHWLVLSHDGKYMEWFESKSAAYAAADDLAVQNQQSYFVYQSDRAVRVQIIEETTRTFYTDEPAALMPANPPKEVPKDTNVLDARTYFLSGLERMAGDPQDG